MPTLRKDPYAAYGFLVEIEGLVVGGFSEVSGLHIETVVETYREGGLNDFDHRLASGVRHPAAIVLKRGLTDDDGLWTWYMTCAHGRIRRRNATIHLLDGRRKIQASWHAIEAFPVKWTGPEFRADVNAVAVESVELAHRGILRTPGR